MVVPQVSCRVEFDSHHITRHLAQSGFSTTFASLLLEMVVATPSQSQPEPVPPVAMCCASWEHRYARHTLCGTLTCGHHSSGECLYCCGTRRNAAASSLTAMAARSPPITAQSPSDTVGIQPLSGVSSRIGSDKLNQGTRTTIVSKDHI